MECGQFGNEHTNMKFDSIKVTCRSGGSCEDDGSPQKSPVVFKLSINDKTTVWAIESVRSVTYWPYPHNQSHRLKLFCGEKDGDNILKCTHKHKCKIN